MSTLSTHVLDTVAGEPVVGLRVHLGDQAGRTIAEGVTDHDGRLGFDADLPGGTHVLTFATGSWHDERGRQTFYPAVVITFEIDPGRPHHHVPLLLGPYGYTTYRGS